MDLMRIAEIYVSTATTKTDGRCEFGTGYLIGNGIVITSAHVLTNAHTKIEVKFRNSPANSGLIDAHLAWDGRPSLDVALLRCQVPNDLPATVQALNTDPPGSGQEAHGKGFPQLTSGIRRDEVGARELTPIRGRCEGSSAGASWFLLDCSMQLKVETAWKGISGAPIFIGDRLIGVLTEHDPAFTTARFRVVSISRLLNDAGFCEAIGWFDMLGEGRKEKLSNEIVKELKGLTIDPKKSVLNRLVEDLVSEVHECQNRSEEGMIAWLAEHFVHRRSEDQLGVLVHVYRELRSERSLDDARAIGRIIDLVLPLEIDRLVLFHVWGQIRQGKAVLVDAAVESRVTAEAALAGVERQRTAFTGQGPSLRGAALVPCDLPAPAGEDVAATALGVLRELCRGYDVYSSESTTIEGQIRDWSTRLKGRLKAKRIGAIKNRTPYCIFERPQTDVNRAILIEALKLIKSQDVDLLFIELSIQSEIKDREVFIFDLLNLRFD